MLIQPITTQDCRVQCLSPFEFSPGISHWVHHTHSDPLRHPPLRARIEEKQLVTLAQRALFDDTYLECSHVELETRRAAVVDEQNIRVQLHVSVTTYLHGAVGLAGSVCRGSNSCEEGAGREGNFGGGR